LVLNYAMLEVQFSDVRCFIDKSGELSVEKYTIETSKQKLEFLLVAACTDEGKMLEAKTARRLMLVPGYSQPGNKEIQQKTMLQNCLEAFSSERFAEAEQTNEKYYEEESKKLELWSDDRRVALDIRIKQLDKEITDARRAARQLPTLKEKIDAKRVIKKLERERDNCMLNYHEEKKKIETKEDELLEEVAAALEMTTRSEPLFSVRWRLMEES